MSRSLGWLVVLSSLIAAAFAPQALANEPCGGLTLEAGVVRPSAPLPADAALDEATSACVEAIAGRLAARAGLRTVTVMVKVPDALRADGRGEASRAAYVERLVAAGLPSGRVSGVVASGEAPGQVALTFTERAATASVGTLTAASGTVAAGPSRDDLGPAVVGASLIAEGWVRTGDDGTAALQLVDGSRIRLRPGTLLHLGKLYLDDALRRVVQLEVTSGGFDTEVTPGGEGSSFRIRTPYGTAGVRGTSFRMDLSEADTRLETLQGAVALEGQAAAVDVAALYGSRVGADGTPEAPRPLLAPPRAIEPLNGALGRRGLRWSGVPKADGYVVEVARDAEFVLDVRTARTTGSAKALDGPVDAGAWFWRVAAVDADGFVGPWSFVHGFDVGP